MKSKLTAASLPLLLIGLVALLSGPSAPGCNPSAKTGLWLRVTSPVISIDRVRIEVWEDGVDAAAPVGEAEVFLPTARTFDAQSERPENQLWILLLAGRETRESSLRIVGTGLRDDREVSHGELTGLVFERNKIREATAILELTHSGEDKDEDGYYVPDDCNDNDPEVHPDQTEYCDGMDNNCDGSIDEGCGCADTVRECWPDWAEEPLGGACRKGNQACTNGTWGTCEGLILPLPEECAGGATDCTVCLDGLDNDCDSFLDAKDTGCGGCEVGQGASCYTGPDGTAGQGICQFGWAECLDGSYGPCEGEVLPQGWDGTEGSQSEQNLCNGYDDDCDGLTDNVTIRPACSNQCGVCGGATQRCEGGLWIDCEAADFVAHAEQKLCLGQADDPLCCGDATPDCYVDQETTDLCDSLDNDCNCAIDDAQDGVCSCPTGESMTCPQLANPDEGECRAGLYNCTGDQWVKDATCIEPAQETCDNLDNDCDGTTDRNPQADQHCLANPQANAELSGCIDGMCLWNCLRNGEGKQIFWDLNGDRNQPGDSDQGDGCEYACALTDPASEICDGQDNDCDSLTDNEDVATNINVLCPPRPNATATTCEAPRDCDYTCNTMFADCFGNDLDLLVPLPGEPAYAGDGCETNLSNNPNHCGACNYACDASEVCVAGACSCGGQGPDCTLPEICCGTVCRNAQTDAFNCGSCGNTCNEHATCQTGACTCDPSWGNCDNDWSDGCETDLRITAAHCSACNNSCGQHAHCTASACECDVNWGNCNNDWSDGCETDLRITIAHCGSCSNNCGGHSACTNSTCGCVTNWGNCDNDWSDGCETDLRVTSTDCGSCDNSCGADAHCTASACACNSNYGNCDNDWSDGCEQYLVNNDLHCGACNNDCDQHASCASTTCSCDTNWGNCDNDWSDGCETDLRITHDHCGSCNFNCGQNATCASSTCSCSSSSWGNCVNGWTDGCETDLRVTHDHCGSCNFNCGQNAVCSSSNCACSTISYDNCNDDWSDGCEVHLPSDAQNCGACDNDCGQNTSCSSSTCTCLANFDDCNTNPADGCEANLLTSSTHCGGCNNACGQHAHCDNGSCACDANWGNCDGDWSDGCETDLRITHDHCGSCNTNCGQNAVCSASTCSCTDPFGNCVNGWTDGCETNTDTSALHCGSCNNACGQHAHCNNGACECDANWGNCLNGWADGCETDLTGTDAHCGSCNNDCGQHASCTSSTCGCDADWGNCDNDWSDGCETDLTSTATDCSVCGNSCGQHAHCSDSACACDADWMNCSGGWADGCEADILNDPAHCGGCSACLAGTNASVECKDGGCVYTCTGNYTDCNGSPENCETLLGTDANCAGCSDACYTTGHEHCVAGACTCDANWEDCDSNPANGCEADLTSNAHCGACYDPCPGSENCNAGVCQCNANSADCDRSGPPCECDLSGGNCCSGVGTSTCLSGCR